MNNIHKKQGKNLKKSWRTMLHFVSVKIVSAFASESIAASKLYVKSRWPYICLKTNGEKEKRANFQTQMSCFLGKIKDLAKSRPICCLFTSLRLPHLGRCSQNGAPTSGGFWPDKWPLVPQCSLRQPPGLRSSWMFNDVTFLRKTGQESLSSCFLSKNR